MTEWERKLERIDREMLEHSVPRIAKAWLVVRPSVVKILQDNSKELIAGCPILPWKEYDQRCGTWDIGSCNEYCQGSGFVVVELPTGWEQWERENGKDIEALFYGTGYHFEDASDEFALLKKYKEIHNGSK